MRRRLIHFKSAQQQSEYQLIIDMFAGSFNDDSFANGTVTTSGTAVSTEQTLSIGSGADPDEIIIDQSSFNGSAIVFGVDFAGSSLGDRARQITQIAPGNFTLNFVIDLSITSDSQNLPDRIICTMELRQIEPFTRQRLDRRITIPQFTPLPASETAQYTGTFTVQDGAISLVVDPQM